nr:acetoacetate--CoA ligase [Desulfuromonadales bacterium]
MVDRLGQIQPRVLFTAPAYSYNGKVHDCLQKVGGILEAIPSIERVVVVPYTAPDADLSGLPDAVWLGDYEDGSAKKIEFARLPFDHPLYILYSSG